ncbi:hypothetical protein IIA15_10950 [candidate division TA06 bacterium]|nr:hypothetical protein [candidate division TA06 bacterium]
MLRFSFWKVICAFIGTSLLLSTNAQSYNEAQLDAAARGLRERRVMKEFIILYKGDPGQLVNRKDLLYISYELVRSMEKGDESIKNQLKLINKNLQVINQRVTTLSATGTGGKTTTVMSPDIEKEVKILLPPLIEKNPRLKKMEREIAALKKNQKPLDPKRRGSDKHLDSQVRTARLIAGTSIAVTLFSVLFMAR